MNSDRRKTTRHREKKKTKTNEREEKEKKKKEVLCSYITELSQNLGAAAREIRDISSAF
jgi:hypothetical protein